MSEHTFSSALLTMAKAWHSDVEWPSFADHSAEYEHAVAIIAFDVTRQCLDRLGYGITVMNGKDERRRAVSSCFGVVVGLFLSQTVRAEGMAIDARIVNIRYAGLFFLSIEDLSKKAELLAGANRMANELLNNTAKNTKEFVHSLAKLVNAYVLTQVEDVGVPRERLVQTLASSLGTLFSACGSAA